VPPLHSNTSPRCDLLHPHCPLSMVAKILAGSPPCLWGVGGGRAPTVVDVVVALVVGLVVGCGCQCPLCLVAGLPYRPVPTARAPSSSSPSSS
jgi:hypothetical protein